MLGGAPIQNETIAASTTANGADRLKFAASATTLVGMFSVLLLAR